MLPGRAVNGPRRRGVANPCVRKRYRTPRGTRVAALAMAGGFRRNFQIVCLLVRSRRSYRSSEMSFVVMIRLMLI